MPAGVALAINDKEESTLLMSQLRALRPIALFVALAAASWASSAAVVTVLPTDTNWANPAGENSGNGSSAITGTEARSGNGSLELFGDRTRFIGLGNPYSAASNLGLLSDVLAFSFDWMIAAGSAAGPTPGYTPALRLHIWDGNQRSELIWEGAYNGTPGTTSQGTWYSSGANDNFWRFQTGIGQTNQPIGGAMVTQSLANWVAGASNNGTDWYSDQAYVAAISIGVGSSASSGYHAFADNVVFNTVSGGERTFNFEVAATGAVPEPTTVALVGLALLGAAAARRRQA